MNPPLEPHSLSLLAALNNPYVLSALGLLGGLAVFLFGMQLLTEGVQKSLNPTSRVQFRRFTRHPILGFVEGVSAASLIQSGPVIVTLIGFINAGIVTFPQSVGVLMGASVGSTISMQLIAINIGAMAYVAILAGYLMRRFAKNESPRALGTAMLGLGLLFLGMSLMRIALDPLRASGHVAHFLLQLNDGSAFGGLKAVAVAALLAALVQSSGAVIAIVFSLAGDGGIASLPLVVPLLAGAHIGGSAVSMWCALDATTDARRTAGAHLVFNTLAAVLCVPLAAVYCRSATSFGEGLIRHIANLNTLIQSVPAILLLPFAAPIARAVEKMLPEPKERRDESYLDASLVKWPERAILASALELKRQASITKRMLERTLDSLISMNTKLLVAVERDEETVNTIKHQIKAYLQLTAQRETSHRQALLLQHLGGLCDDIERIGDHIKAMSTLTRRKLREELWFSDEAMRELMELGGMMVDMLGLTVASLDPLDSESRLKRAREAILIANRYRALAQELKNRFEAAHLSEASHALAGIHYIDFVSRFDRMVRHMRGIARDQAQQKLIIKTSKFEEAAEPAGPVPHPPEDFVRDRSFRDFLARIEHEQHELEQARTSSAGSTPPSVLKIAK